jgi:hypothetical protein
MRKFLVTAAVLCISLPAHASGWYDYYDCGDGVMAIFSGWHGKTWMSVEGNHKIIREEEIFKSLGIAIKDGTDGAVKEDPLNADKKDFRFRIKWHGKTHFIHWHVTDKEATVPDEVSLDGKSCHDMGDGRYQDTEAYKYEEKKK